MNVFTSKPYFKEFILVIVVKVVTICWDNILMLIILLILDYNILSFIFIIYDFVFKIHFAYFLIGFC